jgi:hypothetical protein
MRGEDLSRGRDLRSTGADRCSGGASVVQPRRPIAGLASPRLSVLSSSDIVVCAKDRSLPPLKPGVRTLRGRRSLSRPEIGPRLV